MFSNCIERLGHIKNNNKQQETNKEKPRKKVNKYKMGIIAATMNHYPRNTRKEILNSPPDKFLIPVNQTYLYATLPPRGLYRL